ncbi:MAG: YfiR family protein [Betaproteobacteria bacterium]|nr:MAG: YfiR family protein [Betaproteobacteria bacterium]TMH89380.1 MAG: YfiR family protein [Betaproteobacteria bacterium]
MDFLNKRSCRELWRELARTIERPLRACALSILVAAGIAGPCAAQSDAQTAEYRVKAAFLYKFGGYVEWPQGVFAKPDSPIAIGVIGADALAEELARIVAGRTINGRPVTVRKLRPGEAVARLHVLFVGRSDSSRLADILAAAKGQPLLTVTESEEALELGSMINFVVVEDKVRFDIAPPPFESSNLKISARLLGVARKVVSKSS